MSSRVPSLTLTSKSVTYKIKSNPRPMKRKTRMAKLPSKSKVWSSNLLRKRSS